MKEGHGNIGRRSVLKSASSLIGGGLVAGSAAAAKDKKATDNQKVSKFKKLTDSIAVANGKAKVKGRVSAQAKRRTSGKEKVEISANGKSLTFTAQKIAKQMNEGVEKGFWKIKESAGELDVELTEKGRSRFLKNGNKRKRRVQPLKYCPGKAGESGDLFYLDDCDVDSIQWGAVLSGGVFTIAAAIAGVIVGIGIAPIVLTIAAVLATCTAAYIAITNEGCGIKIDPEQDSVSAQRC